jgi:hypothetical protein
MLVLSILSILSILLILSICLLFAVAPSDAVCCSSDDRQCR